MKLMLPLWLLGIGLGFFGYIKVSGWVLVTWPFVLFVALFLTALISGYLYYNLQRVLHWMIHW